MKRGASDDLGPGEAKRARKETVFDLIKRIKDDEASDFNLFWNIDYKCQATPEEMLEIVQDGPNKGKSGLWFVAFEGKFADFYQRFKKGTLGGGVLDGILGYFQGGPNQAQWALFKKALFSKAENGAFKGMSPFWLLSYRNPESSLEIFELVKSEISLDDMLALPEEGVSYRNHRLLRTNNISFLTFLLDHDFEKGSELLMRLLAVEARTRSVVDCFLLQADKNQPLLGFILKHNLFMKVWEAFGDEIQLEDLWRKCHISGKVIGLHYLNGERTLLQLILAYASIKPALLFEFLEALKSKNRLSHLFRCNGTELDFFSLLETDVLEEVLRRFDEDIALEDLIPLLQSAYDALSLKSILRIWDKHFTQKDLEWYSANKLLRFFTRVLTSASYLETPEHIKQRVKTLMDQIDFRYLVKAEDSSKEAKTILWYAALFCSRHGDFELFRTLWDRHQDQITFDDVHTRFFKVCGTVISILAQAIYTNLQNPSAIETFLLVYKKFKHLIHLEAMIEGPVFFDLASAASSPQCRNDHKAKIIKILTEKLQQDPGIIMQDHPLFRILQNVLLNIDVNKLIESRNALFTYLDSLKEEPMDEEKYNKLMILAKTAFEAGYINAFYDIRLAVPDAQHHEILENVPPKSCHYQKVSYALAEHYYVQFTNGEDCLPKALEYALRLSDPTQHDQFIQKVGYYFISDSKPGKGVQPAQESLVSVDQLAAFNELTGVETCLVLFKEMKTRKQKEATIQEGSNLKLVKD